MIDVHAEFSENIESHNIVPRTMSYKIGLSITPCDHKNILR